MNTPTPTPRTNSKTTTSPGRNEHWQWVEADFSRNLECELFVFCAELGHAITAEDTADSAGSKVVLAMTDLQALKREVDALKTKNSEYHRRYQQAEAAVKKTVADWKKHGGPRGGSFGRALLACECTRLEEQLRQREDQLKAANELLKAEQQRIVNLYKTL